MYLENPNIAFRARAVRYLPPLTDNLLAVKFFQFNSRRAKINFAPGKPKDLIVGSPTMLPEYGQFHSGYDYIRSQVDETDAFTIYIVAMLPESGAGADTKAMLFANGVGTSGLNGARSSAGIQLRQESTTVLRLSVPRWTGSAATGHTRDVAYTEDTWAIFCAQGDATRTALWNLTTDVGGEITTANVRERSLAKVCYGSAPTATYNGDNNIAAIYHYAAYHDSVQRGIIEGDLRERVVITGATI